MTAAKKQTITVKRVGSLFTESQKIINHWHIYDNGRFAGIYGRKHEVLTALQRLGVARAEAEELVKQTLEKR